MRKNKRKDSTANQRMQRYIQRIKDNGGQQFTLIIDGQTRQALAFLMQQHTGSKRELISQLILQQAKQQGFID